MAFTTKKPDRGPSPALDASNIQGNFAAWDTIFAVNHVAINQRFQGDHSYVVFQRQSSDPTGQTNYNTLYSKNAAAKIGTEPQVFINIPKYLPTIPSTPMQLTYSQVNAAGPQYQSFLPGGYVVYFGSEANINLTRTVTLTPEPTKILIAIATPNNFSSVGGPPWSVRTNILTNKTFSINTESTGANTFGYIAVAQV